ncbi:MAG TPA: hypothetical protein VK458_27665, partial [Myxococcaceae bacterium]|nr:hypothetical protein [Myxococcaceae bacterium]
MSRATFFVERRETLRVSARNGSVEEQAEREAGVGLTERDGSAASYRWWDAGAHPPLPDAVRPRGAALLDGRAPDTQAVASFVSLA